MLKIRRSHDRLIFNMGIPIPGKDSLNIETGPCLSCIVSIVAAADLVTRWARVWTDIVWAQLSWNIPVSAPDGSTSPQPAPWWCHMGFVNICSDIGLWPDGTKPLPEPELNYHQCGSVPFTWRQLHCKFQSLNHVWKPSIKNHSPIPQGTMISTSRHEWVNLWTIFQKWQMMRYTSDHTS